MSRIAQLLEVKSPVDGTTRDAQYQVAMRVYLGKTGRENTKVLIIDPTAKTKLSKQVVELPGAADSREFLVVGLDDRDKNEVLSEIYGAIGEGYVVCFADDDGKSTAGSASDLSVKKISGEEFHYTLDEETCTRLRIPSDFVPHMQRLQAFSDYVVSVKGGLDKVDVAGETQPKRKLSLGLGRNGSLYDPKDPTDEKNRVATAFLQGKAARLGTPGSEALSQAKGMLLTAIDDLKVKIIEKAAIPEGDKTGLRQLLSEQCDLRFKRQEIQDATAVEQMPPFQALLVGAINPVDDHRWTLIELQYEAASRLKNEVDTFLKTATAADDNWLSAQEKVAQANALIARLKAALKTPAEEQAIAAVVKLEAEIATLTQTLQERLALVATTKEEHEAAAEKAQQAESATHHLLTIGFYSKDKDLSHVFAEKGLKEHEGKLDAATNTLYAGAFILPDPKDTKGASLNPLETALTAAKQKIDSTAADKITLPVTLRFLMHAPGTPGHETVLDVAIDAFKKITITHFDSLLPVGTSQSHSSFPAAVLTKIQGVFADYTIDPTQQQAANSIGTQVGVECVYFAVAEIAKNHNTTVKTALPLPGTALDDAGKTNMKLAVTKLMADAVQHDYKEAHAATLAGKQPLKTQCVDPTALRVATENDVAKYAALPASEKLAVGDIVYPVVLENRWYVHEINSAVEKAKGDVKALSADPSFGSLCDEFIKNNAPAMPDFSQLAVSAQSLLIAKLIEKGRKQLLEALQKDVPSTSPAFTERLNAEEVVKKATTPQGLLEAVLAKFETEPKPALTDFRKVMSEVQDQWSALSAKLVVVNKSLEPKKVTTTAENFDAFKNLDEATRKKAMFSLSGEMKKTFKLPSQFKKVDFEIVKQKNKQTGQTEDAISVVKTADKDECRMTLSVTVTKADKAQAEKPVDVTLVRTVTGEKVERKCETTSDLVDWETQCALMAAASIAERREAAKLESTTDKKVEPDLNIRVDIKNSGDAVPGQLIGGVKRDGFSHDEAIMINAYLKAGYTRVQCQGVDFYPAGQTKASSYALTETRLSSVLKTGGDPDLKLPNVATAAPKKDERPEGKKGLFLDIVMPFKDSKTPDGLSNEQQARAILSNARELHAKGYPLVGITYSANQTETAAIRAAYDKKPTPDAITGATKTGANQAEVMVEVENLLAKSRASGGFDDLQGVFRIVPITTMSKGGSAPVKGAHDTAASLEAAKAFVQSGGALLGWQNQHGASAGAYAVGGGVATKAFAKVKGDSTEVVASKKELKAAYSAQHEMIQDALSDLKKEYSPEAATTKKATL